MTVILRKLQRRAAVHGLRAEEVLGVATLLWALGDAFSTRAVVAHQEGSIAQAVADADRRLPLDRRRRDDGPAAHRAARRGGGLWRRRRPAGAGAHRQPT
ncbi:hypothetical protein H3H54_15625 [Brachybacterium sp. Z12]|uniref:hypothetical protein n=1 Tax=Brachybacterium sp. Z12 TaxID=2759167 RepID=UPI001861DB10|nr:hypothetical protein [Brachybacterium sp. Z12]QNN82407.1 hypothetical protein H3H54_15625 [Brachybacterium sp. Z12]